MQDNPSPPTLESLREVDVEKGVKSVEGGAGNGNGSQVVQNYRHRRLNFYPVTEEELVSIAALNKVATLFFSLASFFTALAIDLYKDAFLVEGTAFEKIKALDKATLFIGGAAVVCFVVGVAVWLLKKKQTDHIISQSFGKD